MDGDISLGLRVIDIDTFGGVDSRSNPVNLPQNRSLRTRNFVVNRAGWLQLRDGYTHVSTSGLAISGGGALHSAYGYLLNGSRYILFWQGTVPYVLTLATGVITSPTVKGTAIASSSRWTYWLANQKVYGTNGTDTKFFDGTYWRDIGLPALTTDQLASATISDGVREVSSAEASSVTLTASGSGSTFTASKWSIYVAYFDPTTNELGPATISVASGPVTLTAGQNIAITGLPNLSSVNSNWVKLLAGAPSNASEANFFFVNYVAITSCTRSGTTLTVVCTAHGLSTGDVVSLDDTTNFNGIYAVTVVDANTFTVTLGSASGANTAGGGMRKLFKVANATTTATIVYSQTDTNYQANEPRGLAVSSIGGSQPGYLFYAAIYNPTTGHVGNRTQLSLRYQPGTTSGRCNVHIGGLPDLSGTDSEWGIVIGRTGDGATIPYICDDDAGNWIYVRSGVTSAIISSATFDGNSEVPYRNGQPPALLGNARVGTKIFGYVANSPTIYKSGDPTQFTTGTFVGLPEQAWYASDIETFPTGENVTCQAEYNNELWAFTENDLAIYAEQAGVQLGWQGPFYGCGCVGQQAFTKGWSGLPFWLTSEKCLATMSTVTGLPVPISDEYEGALLSRIGDAYLSKTELRYFTDRKKMVDVLVIKAFDSNGNPFHVIHDFNLRDDRSPYGQGYDSIYTGTLASSYTTFTLRDANGKLRLWATASDGNLYQLFDGVSDNGTEFTADQISLPYVGDNNTAVKQIEWYGDPNAKWYMTRDLANMPFPADPENPNTPDGSEFDQLADQSPRSVPNEYGGFHYHVDITHPEFTHAYLWLRLTSHSADAPAGGMALNDPPHWPLETYGRIYMIDPLIGLSRGK